MIFNPYLYTPPTKKNYYFIGAISEDIIIRDSSKTIIDTVPTDATGITTRPLIALPGIYFVTGSVSKYTRMVILKEAGNYKACPDGAIYWHGNILQGSSWTAAAIKSTVSSYTTAVGKPTISKNTNSIYLTSKSSAKAAGTVYLQKINLKSGKIKINYAYTYNAAYGHFKVFNSTANKHEVVSSVGLSDSKNQATLELDVNSESYVGVEICSNNTPTTTRITIYSIVSEPDEEPGINGINIYGAANETITYSGASSGTIPLNNAGYAFFTSGLTPGEYTFVGSIGNFERKITVTDVTSNIYVYPDGALYWYGNKSVAWKAKTINAYASSYHKSYEETSTSPAHYYARIKAAGDQSSYSDCSLHFTTANTVDLSKYSKIKFKVNITAITLKPSNEKGIKLGYSSKNSFSSSSDLDSNITGYYSSTSLDGVYEVASPKDSRYITVASYCDLAGCPSTQNSIAKMYAVWCE